MNKLLKIFLICVVIIFIIDSLKVKEDMQDFKSSKQIKEKIYFGLKTIDEIFNKHGIYYVIGYGTLLGAARHWDVIDWDDDADLIIFKKDIPKIMKLKDEFAKHGLILDKNWKLLKIYFNDTKFPFIDLFPVSNVNGVTQRCLTKYKGCVGIDKKWWTSQYFYPFKWLTKRQRLKLGKIQLWGPVKAINILKHWYGKDCMTKCMTHDYDHITGKYVKPKPVQCKDLPHPQIKL